jgi:hypothetical protein
MLRRLLLGLAVCSHLATPVSARDPVATLHRDCAAALGIPKVALLFLATHDLPHREIWRKWLLAAKGKVPVQQMINTLHNEVDTGSAEQRLKRALQVCDKIPFNTARPLYRQFLFTFYLHNRPDEVLPADRLFAADEQVPERVSTGLCILFACCCSVLLFRHVSDLCFLAFCTLPRAGASLSLKAYRCIVVRQHTGVCAGLDIVFA